MTLEALTLPGVDPGVWQVRNRRDRVAVALADRHYSRQVKGCGQVGGASRLLVLVDRAAIAPTELTHELWGSPPPDGWVTWVADRRRPTIVRLRR